MCVDDVVRLGVEPWRGANFILVEGLKIEFLALSGSESSLVQAFLGILCTIRHYPSIRPHDSEICDSRLSYLEVHTVYKLVS